MHMFQDFFSSSRPAGYATQQDEQDYENLFPVKINSQRFQFSDNEARMLSLVETCPIVL